MKVAPGRYRINVVAELTGVPAATLRAWERRYGIPSPARTAAAYRLYSDDDVAELKRLRDLCAGGLAIAEAARIVHGDRATAPAAQPPTPGDLPPAASLALDAVVAAVRAFDTDRLQQELARALYIGNAQEVFDQVLGPALRRIGDLWHDGSISIAHEHVASGLIQGAAGTLARLAQPSDARWRVLLACVEDEDHVIGLHGVAIQMAAWGIRTVNLGARTPPGAVADAIQQLDPDAVGLSVTLVRDAARDAARLDAYAAACAGRPWFVGGAGAVALAEHVRKVGGIALVGALSDHRMSLERALSQRGATRP
jgi:DNA-binding transcriptional MerR regulator/methylmalonyl-CoA mutase cobalamin-binding subunit